MRRWNSFVVVAAVAAVGIGVLPAAAATGGPRAGGSHAVAQPGADPRSPVSPGANVRYAIDQPLCSVPTNPYAIRCFAMRRVPVAKGTPGAYAYRTRPDYASGPADGFTPSDLASAYGYNPASGGANQTVGIVDWYDDPYALNDLNAFDTQYGLAHETATSFRKVNQDGNASPLPQADSHSSGEIALDIESVRAVCNHCKIVLVEANNPYDTDLATAENTAVRLGANEVSNSFGGAENPAAPRTKTTLAAFRHPGVVITASTGDNGWYDWDFANEDNGTSSNAPNFPSSDPDVVAVGGTALALNSNGTRAEEDVWNENGADDDNALFDGFWVGGAMGASGGGCSTVYPATAWQQQIAGYAKTGCAGKRMAGDVAALADPYTGFDIYDSYSGGWVTIGGTSLASPLVAAMWALAGGASGAAHPSQALYANATSHPSALYDVTLGGNGWCAGDDPANCASILSSESQYSDGSPGNGNPNGFDNPTGQAGGLKDCSFPHDGSQSLPQSDPFSLECNADTGYDGPSGVGAPHGLGLFAPTNPNVAMTLPSVAKLGSKQAFGATVAERLQGATPVKYVWNWGNGTSTTTTGGTAKHTYKTAGSYTVTVTVTDSAGQDGFTSQKFTVGQPLALVIAGPAKPKAKQAVTYADTGSTDPNTGGALSKVTWSWGDGKPDSSGTSASHRYAKAGKYTITMTVVDNGGVTGSKTKRVTVQS